jgi:hypothetical protein
LAKAFAMSARTRVAEWNRIRLYDPLAAVDLLPTQETQRRVTDGAENPAGLQVFGAAKTVRVSIWPKASCCSSVTGRRPTEHSEI